MIPHRFLVRVSHPCPYVPGLPGKNPGVFELPDSARVQNLAGLDGLTEFADVRLGWNELGIAFSVRVQGKKQALQCDANRVRFTDGVSLWLDTRDARSSHRASRFCHQYHLLPMGHADDPERAYFEAVKINRALMDAPLCSVASVQFFVETLSDGYVMSLFLPGNVLTGYDPEQHPRLGFYYQVRDLEFGEQCLGVGNEFPFSDDPSLWEVLDLVKSEAKL